jgi:hypothetical protein
MASDQKKKSTTDALFIIRHILEKAHESKAEIQAPGGEKMWESMQGCWE